MNRSTGCSVFFGVSLKVSIVGEEHISSDIEFPLTGAAERKDREPKLVLYGVRRR